MSRALLVAGLVALVAPGTVSAQADNWSRWNDEAPTVRLSIDGPRGVPYGGPVLVHFEVSDNAYAAVVRVDGSGRMTILFPYSRTQRAAVRGGLTHYVRHPRLGAGHSSFFAADRFSGYVFAIASYSPLDLSGFENRDYDRMGGHSTFTRANRSVASRPDVFIDRFAAAVLWDRDTPFDYDVDYYHTGAVSGMMSAYSMCGGLYSSSYGYGRSFDYGYHPLRWDSDFDFMAYPYGTMCGQWYRGVQCYSMFAFYNYMACSPLVVSQPPTVPTGGQPVDSAAVPNEGVVKGGLTAPTPTPIPTAGPESPPLERKPGRFDQPGGDLDRVLSIPPRATRKIKAEDERAERGGSGPDRSASGATTLDRGTSNAPKPEKERVAEHVDRPVREAAPPREPTKTKVTDDRRDRDRSTTGFGSTGRSPNPRPVDIDRRADRPAETSRPASPPASSPGLSGTSTTDKKKPPMN